MSNNSQINKERKALKYESTAALNPTTETARASLHNIRGHFDKSRPRRCVADCGTASHTTASFDGRDFSGAMKFDRRDLTKHQEHEILGEQWKLKRLLALKGIFIFCIFSHLRNLNETI